MIRPLVQGVVRRGDVFEFEGRAVHGIVVLDTTSIADPAFSERDDPGPILDTGTPVRWLPLREVEAGRAVLYPTGLLQLLVSGAH